MPDPGSLTLQIDTSVPAVFILLKDPAKMAITRSIRVAPGIIVNLDKKGRLVALELMGPVDLDFVMTEVAQRFNAPELAQLEVRRNVIEEVLTSSVQ